MVKDLVFELEYAPCVSDSSVMGNTIQLAQDLLTFCKGKVIDEVTNSLELSTHNIMIACIVFCIFVLVKNPHNIYCFRISYYLVDTAM